MFHYLRLMSIINVRVKNIRKLGYQNLKEWTENDNNVYIGRAGIVFVEKERFPKSLRNFIIHLK